MGSGGCFFLTFIAAFLLTSSFARGTRIQKLQYIFKTFKVDGEGIVDCINIYKQPAFSHPLLVNHTIQVQPSMQRKTLISKDDTSIFNQSWHKYGQCPRGSIPIKRRQIPNLPLRIRRHAPPIDQKLVHQGHQYAVMTTSGSAGTIERGHAKLNVWNPQVNPDGFSLSQIWLAAGQDSQLNTMEAGWHVFPQLTGDTKTRFFIYWTSDGYGSTGCYDLDCPGFVQTDGDVLIGSSLDSSTLNGQQAELDVTIEKNENTGHWWLHVQGNAIGYWPSSLFTSLAKGADFVEYGGEISDPMSQDKSTIPTQMGSGHLPTEGYQRSSYVRDFTYTDSSGSQVHPDPSNLRFGTTSPPCYDSRMVNNDNNELFFFFGGPGCA